MRRLTLILGLLLSAIMSGCAQNHFNIPQDSFADKVKVLGVAPIIVDADSDIRHPQRDELIALTTTQNRVHERDLLRLVKGTNSFYTVTMLDADPKAIFSNMLFRRERRDDAAIQYNKYFWKEEALAELIRKNSLDALMVVVVSGITRPEKIRSSNLVDSLETDYNYLIMTAQILDAKGTILWEYPNFRKRILAYDPLLILQYPDFDEAKANLSPRVQVKFKTMEGIKRSLEKRRMDLLRRETNEVDIYMTQFENMTSLIEVDRDRKPAPPKEQPKDTIKTEPAKEQKP